jgi:hypothetical protein
MLQRNHWELREREEFGKKNSDLLKETDLVQFIDATEYAAAAL